MGQALPPPEAAEDEPNASSLVEELESTPSKFDSKIGILMKENEHSDKRVKFDESKNIIKEFAKNERIESLAK